MPIGLVVTSKWAQQRLLMLKMHYEIRKTASVSFASVQIYLFGVVLRTQWDSKWSDKAMKTRLERQIVQRAILFNPPMKNHVFRECRGSQIRALGGIMGIQSALVTGVRFGHGFETPASHAESKWLTPKTQFWGVYEETKQEGAVRSHTWFTPKGVGGYIYIYMYIYIYTYIYIYMVSGQRPTS